MVKSSQLKWDTYQESFDNQYDILNTDLLLKN
jgi:hypothetical protein